MLNLAKSQIKLKPVELSHAEIKASDIWVDDCLGFKDAAQTLEGLISDCDYPLTVCLDSAWGTGKTFFLRRFCEQYKSTENEREVHRAIYFNAWEDDFLSDPLLAIVGQLYHCFAQEADKKELLLNAARSIPRSLLRVGWEMMKETHPVLGAMAEGVASSVKQPMDDLLEEYSSQIEARVKLKSHLGALAKKIKDETGRPLLFVIDELDRCRPLFAIEMLERIKHLLGVSNIVYVLGIDCAQLRKSIGAVYGDIDAENYLHRFFDIETRLPDVSLDQFFFTMCKRYGLLDADAATCLRGVFPKCFLPLVKYGGLSLREMEKAFRYFVLLYVKNNAYIAHPTLLPLLIVLKIKHGEQYAKLCQKDILVSDLVNALFGSLRGYREFDNCEDVVSFIYRWFVMGEIDEAQRAELKSAFNLIVNSEQKSPALNDTLLADCLKALPYKELKNFAESIQYFSSHGSMSHIDEDLPEIIRLLDCLA